MHTKKASTVSILTTPIFADRKNGDLIILMYSFLLRGGKSLLTMNGQMTVSRKHATTKMEFDVIRSELEVGLVCLRKNDATSREFLSCCPNIF